MDHFSWKRSPTVLLLVLAGILIRLAAVNWLGADPADDREIFYTTIAEEWRGAFSLTVGGNPTAAVMPLYPILLGLFRIGSPESWMPILVLQAILGGLAAWLAYRVAWRIGRVPAVAWGTLLLCLFYPPLVLQSILLEPGPILTFCLALALWFLTGVFRPSVHLVAFMFGAGVFVIGFYLSPKIIIAIPIIALSCGVCAVDRKTGMLASFALLLGCMVALMPWMGRNFIVMGSAVPLNTGFVHTLESSLSEAKGEQSVPDHDFSSGEEVSHYQGSLAAVSGQLQSLEPASWVRLVKRVFPFWVTDYPDLVKTRFRFAQRIVYRTVALVGTIAIVLLALVGMLAQFRSGRAWMLIVLLEAATFQAAFFNQPAHDHLMYWPYLAYFISWGGWVIWRGLIRPPAGAESALSDDLFDSDSEEDLDSAEVWPVPAVNPDDLEPIRGPRPISGLLKRGESEREDGVGPLF